MNKKIRLMLVILSVLIIGSVTVWHSVKMLKITEEQNKSTAMQGSQTSNGEEEHNDSSYQKEWKEALLICQEMVLPIHCENGGGNAVVLLEKEDTYLLCTAAHVVSGLQNDAEGKKQIYIGKQPIELQDFWISNSFDVAFLEVGKGEINTYSKKETGLSEEGYSNLKEGDTLVVWSYFDDEVISMEVTVNSPWIMIEDFGYHMIWANTEDAKGGMSGSGVFDKEGRLAGILCGGNETEVVILPVNIIMGELKNSGIDIYLE